MTMEPAPGLPGRAFFISGFASFSNEPLIYPFDVFWNQYLVYFLVAVALGSFFDKQVGHEFVEIVPNRRCGFDFLVATFNEPVPDELHQPLLTALMVFTVPKRQVGKASLDTVALTFQHQQFLAPENRVGMEVSTADIHSQFQGHVQAEIITCLHSFYPAQVVYAVTRFLY
jgi:hypothetical protein